jgi:predicted GNAT family N-acyltransferase
MLKNDILFREAQPQEVQAITELVLRVFDKYVGCGYSEEGRAVFRIYCDPSAMATRLRQGNSFCQVAVLKQKIIGMIEVRDGNHIALLFVDDRYHKNGIAKNLINVALKKAKATDIEVNSSPFAVNIYKRMGFEQLDEELEKDGIRFVPMKKSITPRKNC